MEHQIKEFRKEDIDKEELKKQIPAWCNLLRESPDDVRLRIIVASMFYFIDEKQKSLKLLKNAPNGENIELKEVKAIVYMDLDYYNEALELFNEILDADYNKSILDLKVDCLFLLEKFEEVIKTADEYLESFGDNLDVLTNKKLALEELNRKNDANEVEKTISNLKTFNKFAIYLPKDQIDETIRQKFMKKNWGCALMI